MMESAPESPPHPKTAYELLRDKKKAEMLKALEPVLLARQKLDREEAKKNPTRTPILERKERKLERRGPTRRGLRGRKRKQHPSGGGKANRRFSEMRSERDSSSEETESNDEAITEDAKEGGRDSSDEDMHESKALLDRRTKRRKATAPLKVVAANEKSVKPLAVMERPPAKDLAPATTAYALGWSWVPGQWMPQQPSQPPPTWPGPARPASEGSWPDVGAAASQDSEDWASRRKRRQDYEGGSRDRGLVGKKPNFVYVGDGGEVDAAL